MYILMVIEEKYPIYLNCVFQNGTTTFDCIIEETTEAAEF